MQRMFPFLSLPQSIIVLRLSTALIFLLHSVVRVCNGTIPRFADYLVAKGMPLGKAWVIAITVFEIAGSVLLVLNHFTKAITLGFIILLLAGIVLIHAERGWFVGEHGSGGCEYSFILIIALIVIAAADKDKKSQYRNTSRGNYPHKNERN
ncbi:MAG TPA: DoxX family protein [Chitinophagaceae bacterium]|nr:DoxX family protein [Chitinophagaceae bacterium]